jgi:hypothetical protein
MRDIFVFKMCQTEIKEKLVLNFTSLLHNINDAEYKTMEKPSALKYVHLTTASKSQNRHIKVLTLTSKYQKTNHS